MNKGKTELTRDYCTPQFIVSEHFLVEEGFASSEGVQSDGPMEWYGGNVDWWYK